MRKIILAIILIAAGWCTNAQDLLTRESVIVYGFKDFSVILVCQRITDSLLNQPGTHTEPPSKQRVVSVYDDFLRIFIATNIGPFLHPVTRVALDADTNDKTRISIKDLEMRRGLLYDGIYTDWKNVQNFPLVTGDSPVSFLPLKATKFPVTEGDYYKVFELAVGPYARRVISIRNKHTKEEILNIHLKIIGKPEIPFLRLVTQDDSDKKLIDSFITVSAGMMKLPDVKIVRQKGQPLRLLLSLTMKRTISTICRSY